MQVIIVITLLLGGDLKVLKVYCRTDVVPLDHKGGGKASTTRSVESTVSAAFVF